MIVERLTAFCLVFAIFSCGADQPEGADFAGGSSVTDTEITRRQAAAPAPVAASPGDALVATDATLQASATPADADAVAALGSCYKGEPFACEIEVNISRLVNDRRAASDKPALVTDEGLAWVARTWSSTQLATGVISHDGFPTAREAAYRAEFGGDAGFFIAGENVGTTYGTQKLTAEQLAAELVDMWLNSSGHRANLLGNFRLSGVGIVLSADRRTLMATQIFAQ